MGPNVRMVFNLRGFDDFPPDDMPKGDLFRFGVNPYNKNVVLSFQGKTENSCLVVESVLKQLLNDLRRFRMTYGRELNLGDFAEFMENENGVTVRPLAVRVRLERGEKLDEILEKAV